MTVPIYELKIMDAGPKMNPDPWLDDRGPLIMDAPGSIHLRNSPLQEFARRLALHLGRPVIDEVQMPGLYRFSLDWAPSPGEDGGLPSPGPTSAPSTSSPKTAGLPVFQAIQDQLGLRLDPAQGSVDVIVIDKAERPPL
jgi:uncharacterized protein (TIGR03435 family)